jgi:hypothetical protein
MVHIGRAHITTGTVYPTEWLRIVIYTCTIVVWTSIQHPSEINLQKNSRAQA